MNHKKTCAMKWLRGTVRRCFPGITHKMIGFRRNVEYRKYFRKRKLEIHLADHCNLNCRCCNHYSPLADETFISLTELREMYEKLKPFYHRFFKGILLLGGEPLLNPEIEKIMQLTASYFPDTEIEIVTNGIKLNIMDEGFWEACRKYNVLLSITRYPGIMEGDGLETLLKEKGAAYCFWGFRENFYHGCLDPDGKQNAKKNWHKCYYGGNCLQLRNGRIFPCAQSAYIEYINRAFGTKFQHQKGDSLSLEELKSGVRFWRFVLTPRPFCRYCNMDAEREEKWEISQKKREEWL